ncbi:MAG: short-chain dehydrogenase, partial [Deltaproteobacteria bacterium]|nr:short-chain dehydrogenase [Deltaproteobacteria bacterium]
MELDQLKVIITGGASGLGEHFAKQLLAAGAQVAVGDV